MKSKYDAGAALTCSCNFLVCESTCTQDSFLPVEELSIGYDHVSYDHNAQIASKELHLLLGRLATKSSISMSDFIGVSKIIYDATRTRVSLLIVHPI